MCVEIKKQEKTISYKPDLSFDDQMKGTKEVLIDCDCEKVHKFLDEVEKACNCGKNLDFTIKLKDNNNFQVFKKIKKLNKDITVNDILHKIVTLQINTDNKLKELCEAFKG